MPQPRRTSARSRAVGAVKSRGRKLVGPKAIGRIEKSLDAAELALRDLRKELGRGSSGIVKDLDKTIKDSRKNLRSLNRTVLRDLEKLQKAATRGTPPRAARATGSRSTASRSTGGARKTASTRKTTSRSGARSTASRSSRSRAGGGRSTRSTRSK